ncbi:serine carboxypeptidase, partial [Olea europaea subsp. europaea]
PRVLNDYLCAWGNDAASEVLTEARLLLVENYFQTPSSAWACPWPSRISGKGALLGQPSNSSLKLFKFLG